MSSSQLVGPHTTVILPQKLLLNSLPWLTTTVVEALLHAAQTAADTHNQDCIPTAALAPLFCPLQNASDLSNKTKPKLNQEKDLIPSLTCS